MQPNKITQLLDRHGLRKAELARMAYTTERTIDRWSKGQTPICPARYHIALDHLAHKHPDTAADLRDHVERMQKAGWDV